MHPRDRVRVRCRLLLAGSVAGGLVASGVTALGSTYGAVGHLTSPTPGTAADLCVAAAGAGASTAGVWLGLCVLACGVDDVRGASPGAGGLLRPCVLQVVLGTAIACGSTPANAGPQTVLGHHAASEHASISTPPPLPLRPLTGVVPSSTHVVRPGDCLWDVAGSVLGPSATHAEISRAWRRLYEANRDRIGPEPDLLVPGTTLTLPDRLTPRSRAA